MLFSLYKYLFFIIIEFTVYIFGISILGKVGNVTFGKVGNFGNDTFGNCGALGNVNISVTFEKSGFGKGGNFTILPKSGTSGIFIV